MAQKQKLDGWDEFFSDFQRVLRISDRDLERIQVMASSLEREICSVIPSYKEAVQGSEEFLRYETSEGT